MNMCPTNAWTILFLIRKEKCTIGSAKDALRLSWELQEDFFSSNMLLDSELHPNISNFGMTRTFERDQTEAKTKQCLYGPQSMQLMETFQ